jgi:hypothetical protein
MASPPPSVSIAGGLGGHLAVDLHGDGEVRVSKDRHGTSLAGLV